MNDVHLKTTVATVIRNGVPSRDVSSFIDCASTFLT